MGEESIAIDSVFELCRDQHRRIVLAVLMAEQRSLTLNDLTQVVLTYKHGKLITDVSKDVLSRIRNSLYHIHIPKLAAAGLITYDPERLLVEPTERLEQAKPTISSILDADPALDAPFNLSTVKH